MTTRFTKIIAALATAALIGVGSAPAMAAGQISIGFTPSDPEQAQALGMGLKMFSLVKGMSATGANAYQNGNGNSAGFNQNGNNNTCGLFQFGQTTNAQCMQNGNDQTGITTVFGF